MPYENEHSCRLNSPDKYDKFARKNCEQKHDGKCIDVIYGIKEGKSEIQALRFDKKVWTAEAAKSVCGERKGSFEPASEKKTNDEQIEQRFLVMPELRIVEVDNQLPKITGYAAVFEKFSEFLGGFKEKISKGAFSDTIQNDDIRALVNHEPAAILGRNKAGTLELKEDDNGLFFVITPPDTTLAKDTIISIKRGDLTGASFGFRTITDEWTTEDNKTPIRTLKKAKLHDISIVAYPAYPDTTVALRSLDDWKKSQGETIEKTKQDHTRHMRLRLEREI